MTQYLRRQEVIAVLRMECACKGSEGARPETRIMHEILE